MKTKGFFWHVHHDVLCEWSEDITERIKEINREKPDEEIPLRLKLMKPVMGRFPAKFCNAWKACGKACDAYVKAEKAYCNAWKACGKAWAAYVKAGDAYGNAWKACGMAWEAYDTAGKAYVKAEKAYDKAEEAYVKAEKAYDKAWDSYVKAGDAYVKAEKACGKVLKANEKQIEKLHWEECPTCPWDGRTIFPEKDERKW